MLALRLIVILSALLVPALASSFENSHLHRVGNHTRRGPGGWNTVQYPAGAHKASIPVQGGNLELYAMGRKDLDYTKLKRAVLVIHGQGRDPWNYYSHMTAALTKAHSEGMIEKIHEIGIWAPSFWCQADEGVWPASETQARKRSSKKQMVWHNSDWSQGDGSIYPASNKGISSFTALDDAIRYFGDKSIFPKMETIVLASHSMGAQMLHRYAQLGTQPQVTPEVHYYIGNPASYMYLDDRRPNKKVGGATSRSKCSVYNDYKYGLNEVNSALQYNSPHPSNEVIYNRYKSRFVHYQLGTADHASASTSCGAHVQGDSHYNRGRIYQAYLQMLGYPARHTIDYIRGVGHDDASMFASKHGMYRLFVQNERLGKTEPSAASNGLTDGLDVSFTGLSSKGSGNMPTRRSFPERLS